jgi:hypothetical protein
MGEAKRRKAADPSHGRSTRGLVISPPLVISGTSVRIKSSDLDSQEIRSNLLFWDKLDFPKQNLIGFGLSPDSEFLLSAGVLQRTQVTVPSGDGAAILRNAHLAAFSLLDQKEPGTWSVAMGERSISFHNEDLEAGRGALVRLYNAIPVPDKDVPIAEVLEFREKRRTELLALRTYLEGVYQRVITAGDGPLAWNTELDALQRAIEDHIKASKESKLRLRLADISAGLNLSPIGAAGFTAFAAGLPLVPSLITGFMAGISLEVGAALKRRKAATTPFKYVTSYHHELF